jgi:hypothetical protein
MQQNRKEGSGSEEENEGRDGRGLGRTNLYTILLRTEHDDDGGRTSTEAPGCLFIASLIDAGRPPQRVPNAALKTDQDELLKRAVICF